MLVADTSSSRQAGATLTEAMPPSADPLRSSSDSVFLDNASHDQLLGNWEQPVASPQMPVRGRPNPLTSHTTRQMSSSMEHPTRRTTHHPLEWGAGPYSPMAVGNKSRTPSGMRRDRERGGEERRGLGKGEVGVKKHGEREGG